MKLILSRPCQPSPFYPPRAKKSGLKGVGHVSPPIKPHKSVIMDNRGKVWSIDDDQKLMETPHLPNSYFSQIMGRSDNAIKFRRSHLAVKMHQNDPDTSLEEYVVLMHGEMEHALALLSEWREKRASFTTFMDTTRKRKAREMASVLPGSPAQTEYPSRAIQPFSHDGGMLMSDMDSNGGGGSRPPQSLNQPPIWSATSTEARIDAICRSIRDEGGNLASIFNDPHFIPTLIQHYPGFEAYGRVVQARVSHH
jgi:hypothetical protein